MFQSLYASFLSFIDRSGQVASLGARCSLLIGLLLLSLSSRAQNGTTVAGGNGQGDAANQLTFPTGVYVDGSGNIYVADRDNQRIQKWAPGASSGTTVAGGNGQGDAANQLSVPYGVYVDGSGNIYVADSDNNRIQKWAPGASSGTTVAGGNGRGNDDNQLRQPRGVYVDGSGNIYVADSDNNRIQKWAPGASSGTTVTGATGNGQGNAANQLSFPTGVYVDGSGNIYVADRGNDRIQKWAPGASSGTTVAGGNGDGAAANRLTLPYGVYVDGSGNIYVADGLNGRIQKWAPGASSGTTVAGGNGTGDAANQLTVPYGVYVDGLGNIYAADPYNNRIQKFAQVPTLTNLAANPSTVCAGQPIRFTATVGNPSASYSYTLTNGAGSSLQGSSSTTAFSQSLTASGSGVQSYTLTITTAGGSTSTSVGVTITPRLGITQQPASFSSVNVGANVSVPVSVSGSPTTYQWYKNGSPVDGQTSATLSLNSVQVSQAGSYSLVAIGPCNSVTTNAFSLSVLSPATLSGTKTVSGNVTPGSIVTYIVSLTNSSPYAQLDNPGNEFTDVLPSSLSLISAEANSNNGTAVPHYETNSMTWSGIIPGNSSITITITASIKNNTNGVTVSNQGSISYDADGNGTNEASAQTDDPTIAGSANPTTFVVTCAPITASLSSSGPISDTNPTVTLTASGGTTYSFSSGATQQGNGNTATVIAPGPYSVTVTNAQGCTGVASTTVAGAQNPATVCRNGTVVIKVVATGNPVKYEWYKNTLNSARLADITNLQRGTATSSLTLINQQVTANYYVRVTDANGSAVVYGPFKVSVNSGCITSLGRLAAEEVELKLTLLGNPLIGEQLRATVSGAAGKALNVQLLDLTGKPVRGQQWQQAEADQQIDWNLGGQASGVYLLQATTNADGSTPTQKHSLKVIKP